MYGVVIESFKQWKQANDGLEPLLCSTESIATEIERLKAVNTCNAKVEIFEICLNEWRCVGVERTVERLQLREGRELVVPEVEVREAAVGTSEGSERIDVSDEVVRCNAVNSTGLGAMVRTQEPSV